MLNFIVSTYLLALEVGKFSSESVPGAWGKFLKLQSCSCEFPHYSPGAQGSGLQLTSAIQQPGQRESCMACQH